MNSVVKALIFFNSFYAVNLDNLEISRGIELDLGEFVMELTKVKVFHPSLRIGQILGGAAYERDIFYIPDGDMVMLLKKYSQRLEKQ